MPLYRQHVALLRGEVDIARGTLASWCIKASVLLTPLYEALRQILLTESFIHGDETTAERRRSSPTPFPAPAVIHSIMLTCRACAVEPYAWLRHVLSELPKRQAGLKLHSIAD